MARICYGVEQALDAFELAKCTEHHLNDGWQKAGPIIPFEYKGRTAFLQEYIKVIEDEDKVNELDFYDKLEAMNEDVRDLLYVNSVQLAYEDGEKVTYLGDERSVGINPSAIVNYLRTSKHIPIDFDGEQVLNEIGKLL